VLLIDRKSTRSSDEVSEIDSYHQTFRCSLCRAADNKLFQRVTTDRKHVLHDLIPLAFSSLSELQSATA